MENNLYMLTIDLNPGQCSGLDLPATVEKVRNMLTRVPGSAKCLFKFKITGEAKILAVLEVSNVFGLERMLSAIVRLGNIDVTCKPLKMYEKYAKMLGGEPEVLPEGTKHLADDGARIPVGKQIFVLEIDVKYPGKTLDEVMVTLKEESKIAFRLIAAGVMIGIFKIIADFKVVAFLIQTPDELDTTLLQVPLMKQMGSGVTIYCRAVQRLDEYCTGIMSANVLNECSS